MDDHTQEPAEVEREPMGDTAFAGALLRPREEVVPTPPMSLGRKKELYELAFEIAEHVEREKVTGRELCLLDSFCHNLLDA